MSALSSQSITTLEKPLRIVEVEAPASPDAELPHVSGQLDVNDLRDLMQSVTETAQRLQATHVALHNQVARLQRELAEANAALRRSQSLAALGQMAAGIAHEVRNPLGSIQLYVQMLAEDLADRPEQSALCSKIDRAVVGLDAIVRDVLTFARDMTIRPQPTTATELLERALASCESLLVGRDIGVRREDHSPCRLQADGCLMVQALSNVVRNAIEAMVEAESTQQTLTLGAAKRKVRCPDGRQAQRIVLWVQDTGPGIPEEVVDRVFNPFFTTRATGTGLGLAIVHRIVDAHGGHIRIANTADGGTRVELCLPARPPSGSMTADDALHASDLTLTRTESE